MEACPVVCLRRYLSAPNGSSASESFPASLEHPGCSISQIKSIAHFLHVHARDTAEGHRMV